MQMRNMKPALMFIVAFLFVFMKISHGMTLSQEVKDKYYCNGECEVARVRCSCKSNCKVEKNCCTDYVESCEGGVSWTEEECASAEEMVCPDGYNDPKPLLLVSIDGYWNSYLQRNLTPTIAKLASCGVSVPYIISQYPTKTFPNHYTMVTGLYPESHGIIANNMYNHESEEEFRLGRPAAFNPEWWKGEPIWVTASNQGLKTATYFWPGSDVNITRYPDYWYKYNGSVDHEERVYTMLDWLVMPKEKRPSLINLYTNVVDHYGHNYGPFSEETNEALKVSDNWVKMMMNGLRDRGLDKCVTIMVMSDHGMASLDCENNVRYVGDYGVNMSEVYTDLGPYARIGKSIDKSLWHKFDPVETKKLLECRHEETHWEAFLKTEYLPKRYHYANNPWIEDLHLVTDKEWWIAGDAKDPTKCIPGNHGFDNLYSDMRGLFLGHGPGLKRGYSRSTPFENIELYNLYADLLGITPAPNNGTRGAIYDVMAQSPDIVEKGPGMPGYICVLPDDDSNSDIKGCEGCEGVSESEANERLRINKTKAQENLPYGHSKIFHEDAIFFCLLIQRDYVSTYDFKIKQPRVASFVLHKGQQLSNSTRCVRRDRRVNDESMFPCDYYDDDTMMSEFLYSPDLASDESRPDATLSSNMVPVYHPFAEIWRYMTKSMKDWANLYNGITVDVGPVFDADYDGHADLLSSGKGLVPTHYFIVMTRCRNPSADKTVVDCSKDINDVEVLSFTIPNYKEAPCHKADEPPEVWIPRAVVRHISRVRDIELLTKISFFSKWETDLAAIRLKVHIPMESGDWLQNFVADVHPTGSAMLASLSRLLGVVMAFSSIQAMYGF